MISRCPHHPIVRKLTALILGACVPLAIASCTQKAPRRHASASKQTPGTKKATPPQRAPDPQAIAAAKAQRRARSHAWAERGPLAPVMKASTLLVSIAQKALLKTPKVQDPFAPITGTVAPGLREALLKTKPKELRLMGFEFEFVFFDGPEEKIRSGQAKAAFYLRTFLHPGANGPEFFKISGRVPQGGKIHVSSLPLTAFTGKAALFARAAQGLVGMLHAGRCLALPIVSQDPLRKILTPGPRTIRMLANLRRAKLGRGRLCGAISKLKLGAYHLRLDDASFAVIGQDGHISGMINAELRIKDGKLHLDLKNYRSTLF